ncbi:fungal-specific transcription factor domain-containing protein [Poronia punctata]|nr:fungal-specific transcription factor domain-containing protein [Poronia punctata]
MKHMCLFPFDAASVGSTPDPRNNKANQACYSCRKQKRKCDKALPSCALCARMSRFCDYSETPPNPTVEDMAALKGRLVELENKLEEVRHSSASISPPAEEFYRESYPPMCPSVESWEQGTQNFDPTVFLDAKLFRDTGLSITRPIVTIPPEVLQCIGDTEQVQHLLTNYFVHIHPWFPLVRKRRINVSSSLWDNSPENNLLCMAMLLVAWQPTDNLLVTKNYLYFSAKQFSTQLESAGVASLPYLQALLLIALYEYGHGIYPAAWMTVGRCVRYADFIGLPSYKDSNSMLGNCATWIDAEERRRTWWAVYVLDKVICLGSDKRPLCGEPAGNEILPVPDEAWDSGDASLASQHTVMSPRTEFQSPFARLCQAALLLSKALRHCQRAKLLRLQHKPPDDSEAASLLEGALDLAALSQREISNHPVRYFSALPSVCLAYSAVFKIVTIHLPGSAPETAPAAAYEDPSWTSRNHTSAQLAAYEARKEVMERMHDVVRDIGACASHQDGLNQISPFVLDAVYYTGVTGAWWRDPCGLETIQKALARIGDRWAVAVQYGGLLQQHDIAAVSSSNFSMPMASMPMVPSVPSTTMAL